MSDPVRVPSLDTIPEALHAHFVPVSVDGEELFEYRPPSSKTDDDVRRLDGALRKERERAKQLAEQLQQRSAKVLIGDEEYEPDEVLAAIEAQRKQLGEQVISVADADKRAEERIAKARQAAAKELEALQAQIKERDAQLDAALLDTGIAAAVGSSEAPVRFLPGALEDVQHFIRQHGLAKRNGTEIEVYELDGKTPLTNGKGDRGSLYDVLALVASKRPHWVVESQGSNATPGANGATGTVKKKRADMTLEERAAMIRKVGPEAYAALP